MKILVISATGTIGSAVVAALEPDHEVVQASRSGELAVDMADPASIDRLFATVSDVDAVVCCAASGRLAPLVSGSDEDFTAGLHGKLLGQVALVRRAARHLRDGGSVTLTSGAFTHPTPGSAFGALTNAGLEAFVRAAAIELPRGLRVNVVSPGWVGGSARAAGVDAPDSLPAAVVAKAYVDAVEGVLQGQTIIPCSV